MSTNLRFTQGTVFFDDSSLNLGTVKGDAYFNDDSTNSGTVLGNAHRYKAWLIAHELDGTVTGSITYHSYPNAPTFRNISGDTNWSNTANWFRFATIVLFASTTLKNNIVGDIYIGASTTTINGAYYTVDGDIHGNGAYGGFPAYDFNLEYITVTGSSTAIGGDGNPSIDGGRGGNVIARYSTTGVIAVNGGDPLHNGGDAGTIYILNSIGIWTETPIKAVGGDSIGCGFGGSGGNVTLQDAAQYVVYVEPGRSATSTIAEGGACENPPVGSGGRTGQTISSGRFNPTLIQSPNTIQNETNADANPSGISSKKLQDVLKRFLPEIKFNLNLPDFDLNPLPSFGSGGKNSFSFIEKIQNFLSAPLFNQIKDKFAVSPTLLKELKISSIQDLIGIYKQPRLIENTNTPGLFTIYNFVDTKPLRTYVYMTQDNSLAQMVRVRAGQDLKIYLTPIMNISNYKVTFDSMDIDVYQNTIELTAPLKPGTYVLTSYMTPMSLHIEVLDYDFGKNENSKHWIMVMIEKIISFVKNMLSFVLFW
jgi:hypothetical protein